MPSSPVRPSARASRRARRVVRPATALAAAALAAGVVAGCGSDDGGGASGSGGGGLKVVATTAQMGDLVREVGGDAVDVHQVLQASTDPHEYEPRPTDVTETAKAKIVFASGLGLDAWIGDVVKQSGADATVVEVGDGVPTKLEGGHSHDHAHEDEAAHEDEHAHEDEDEAGHDHAHEDEARHADETAANDEAATEEAEHDHASEDGTDPHWWHDPKNVAAAVGVVRDALVKAEPAAKTEIEKSAAAYLAKVQALDTAIEACVGAVPKADRKLVTSHDAFGYFAHRYDITVVGATIPSQTTQAQPSAGDVDRLTKQIRAEGVKAIFPESSVNPKLSRAIAKETGARADLTLYGDALGEPGTPGATYLGMERANANAVVEGFTGKKDACGAASR